EGHALGFQPLAMLDAVIAIEAQLVIVPGGRAGAHEPIHFLGAVLVTAGVLHIGATAQVEDAFGGGAGAATPTGTFDDQYLGTGPVGSQRGADTGYAGTDNQHVTLVGPLGHGVRAGG